MQQGSYSLYRPVGRLDLSSDSQMKVKFFREKEFNYANLSELIKSCG
jgi:hypothetical protein